MKKIIAFSRLPQWKQRMEIAKDVILQIKAKKFVAEEGIYLNIWTTDKGEQREGLFSMQANKAIKEKLATCNVCAKGALFMSHIMKTNHCTVNELKHKRERNYIERLKMFSQGQLDTIECAFEKSAIYDRENILTGYDGNYTPLGLRAKEFSTSSDDNIRLIKIMNNIIKNKGTFKP